MDVLTGHTSAVVSSMSTMMHTPAGNILFPSKFAVDAHEVIGMGESHNEDKRARVLRLWCVRTTAGRTEGNNGTYNRQLPPYRQHRICGSQPTSRRPLPYFHLGNGCRGLLLVLVGSIVVVSLRDNEAQAA